MAVIDRVLASVQEARVPEDSSDIRLDLFESGQTIGTGRAGDKSYVLTVKGQPGTAPFNARQARFEPWTQLIDQTSGQRLEDVAVLRVWVAEENPDTLRAIAAVFSGLVDLACVAPDDVGEAITAIRLLLESGLQGSSSREVEIGLAGELLAIADSSDPASMSRLWHARSSETFDFSCEGERLDVKATSGGRRAHWFSDDQIVTIPGVCTSILSMFLPLVAEGTTVSELFEELMGTLGPREQARTRTVAMEVCGSPPELLTQIQFDRIAARHSFVHLPASQVPAPVGVPGVEKIRWLAEIPGPEVAAPIDCVFSNLI